MAAYIELGTTGANPVTSRQAFDTAKATEIFRLMVMDVEPSFDWDGATAQQKMNIALIVLKKLALVRAHRAKRMEVEAAISDEVEGVVWE